MRHSILLIGLCFAGTANLLSAAEVDFNNDVRPILSNKCLLCHGPDPEALQAGLRLDRPEFATQELESGQTAIVPGKPEQSELIQRITADDEDIRMPPPDHGAKLTTREVDVLKTWIREGANFAVHWSYVRPQRSDPPPAPDAFAQWPRNAVDHFILKRMLGHGLEPSPEADRYALVRRVFLDLTGLPPTVEEADAFVANTNPNAYEDLVDDLLQRPAFGEHWARKWLDLARYADSAGYADDPARTIWAYRDWVTKAINDNMPFDQFTVEQLAGDLLPNPSERQLIATAFHRNTLTNNEGGTQDEEFRNVAVVDRVNTTMAVWMGTTMACAQCHTHKYDPITQEEYFRFFAILNNTQDADRRDESPLIQVYSDEQKQQKADLELRVASLRAEIDNPTAELAASQQAWETSLKATPAWQILKPVSALRRSELALQVEEDGRVLADGTAADTDTYTIEFPVGADSNDSGAARETSIAAVRLETLPHDSLPAKGSGLGGGNFVITGIKAQIVPQGHAAPQARFVRITNNGTGQILSLAEVQVFSAGTNIALQGKATQHSTAYAGPAEYAIDGNTDGNYDKTSVTHTDTVDNPWWEVDLNSAQPIETIAVWNRTDNGLHTRLSNFTVALLDAQREVVWQQQIKDAPNPSAEYQPTSIRSIDFQAAFADYHQPGFEPEGVLAGKAGDKAGWAIGGALETPHQLVLVPRKPIAVEAPSVLRVVIEHNSPHKNHLLGQFRLSITSEGTSIERSRIPAALLAIMDRKADERSEAEVTELAAYYRKHAAPELSDQRQQLAAAENTLANMKPATSVPVLREMTGSRRETHLQFRGSYLDKGPLVEPGLPAVFTATAPDKPLDRLALAEWLVSEENPLTARVLANRYWETIFGRGIVLTSEEFGSQGEPPSHPLLLDWLATELHRNGWDRKDLLRTLVTSATYRQSARATPEKIASDADNRWLSRGPRIRLSAEMVRDQALFVAGLLSTRMYGPPVNPPQPNLGLSAAFGSSTDWKTSAGEDRYRRAVYTTWRRSNPYPSMATFDAPNREVCTVRRNRTNTPLQSLVTLNDPVYVEAAQSLARIVMLQEQMVPRQLEAAFRRCLLRHPTEDELSALVQLFEDSRQQFTGQPEQAMQLATDPLGPLPEGIDTVTAAAMTVVSNVLLNLDEMFLKR